MLLDSHTIKNLEIIYNMTNGSNKYSLLHTMNCCKTITGQRLLRANLIRPLTDLLTLETRYDVIEFFLNHQTLYSAVVDIVAKFPDMDKMINSIVTKPKFHNNKTARNGIDTLICLKYTLKLVPVLLELMNECTTLCSKNDTCQEQQQNGEGNHKKPFNPLFCEMKNNLQAESLQSVMVCM